MQKQNAAAAAIQFALETDDGMAFLRCWNEGDFDAIRREWPEAPESVFVGADPLHVNSDAFLDGKKRVIADIKRGSRMSNGALPK